MQSKREQKKVLNDIPVTLGEAINDYINGPLLLHRSAENEKYPLRVTAESWLGDIVTMNYLYFNNSGNISFLN